MCDRFVPEEMMESIIRGINNFVGPFQIVLVLIRGLSGMGKSTLAKQLLERVPNIDGVSVAHFEADSYFNKEQKDGTTKYIYDRNEVEAAHSRCKLDAFDAMRTGVHLLVVSNTFVRLEDMDYYKQQAEIFGYTTVIYDAFHHRMELCQHVKNCFPHFMNCCSLSSPCGRHKQELVEFCKKLEKQNKHDVGAFSIYKSAQNYQFSQYVLSVRRGRNCNRMVQML